MAQTNVYDPENWLVSMHRAVEEYVKDGIDAMWTKPVNQNLGLKAYDVIFDFPAADELNIKIPFRNEDGDPVTLIHLVIDDIENRKLGFGTDYIKEEVLLGSVFPTEGERHVVNFDVGIWATDASGGVTSRLVTYQALNQLFHGPSAWNKFEKLTDGLQIVAWNGGRMVQDRINDILVYRTIDCTLVIDLFSQFTDDKVTAVDDGGDGILIHDTVVIPWE
jgi:hypothetical protein